MNTVEFKDSPVGRIPVDWGVSRVSEVFDVFTGTTPSTKIDEFWDDGDVVWVTPADMSNLNGIMIADSERKVTVKALKRTNLNLIPKLSILISTRAPVGYVALNTVECVFNQGCKALVPKSHVDTRYFAYYLLINKKRLQDLSGGSTFKELNKKTLEKIYLPVPPLEEQKRISEILQDVDGAIEKVNKEIGVTEKLKRGLMQRLLMEGINHTEFKDSHVGRIPVDWDVVNLEDVVEIHDNKRIPLSEKERIKMKGDYPYCGANGIIDYINDYIFNGEFVLLAEDGGDYSSFGSSAYIMNGKFWVNNHAHVIEALPSKITNRFLLHILIYLDLTHYVVGSTRKKLNQGIMRKIKIPLPPLEEQKRISEILQDVDRRLELLTERKVKLENIKRGLMNDLLTGKRRVRITS
ncbi:MULTISPECIES: restriction endonuclease subunit S [Methanothermobacter]|uniref:Type I restriction modification system, subunit S n=2 Tax=Methanothermobacter thermautotrophicus TaxID=145262 RepID=O27024_METTH|nr:MULTISPECIES: restriction endonuclease subunit S [Methanothermobacter]AAB85439.1 type I restriction modification system, subunit S [Methanothermobacter thermautotrophicus str. Delta H]MDI6818719.1 restriction endonuclease subunit S [Methanothermobacter thermautotrophicus]QHN08026.1 restriction endonuclease subunit S [Methanothermobacter sp. THM-2]WBF07152.1 restriction endonuclease subunit S [Methanothermobacter thermautotrophicus]WBF08944.1 restriction endonuclease subunit S [Methanothermo